MTADFGLQISDWCALAQISVQQGAELVDKLSDKNDRWLFLALLVVFLLAIAWLVKWGSAQLEKRDLKLEEMGREIGKIRDNHGAEVAEIRDKHEAQLASTTEKLSGIIADNTRALLIFAQSMGIKREQLQNPTIGAMDLRP